MAEERTGGNRRLWAFLADVAFDIAGCGLLAIGIQVFTAPNNIAPGGVSGIAVILNHLTGLPIGGISFLINLPLMALGLRFLGKRFTLRTFKSVVILSLMVDYVVVHLPAYRGDLILASLFGGVTMGAGLALVFLRGSTTGGTDIASRLLQLKFPHISMGRMLFFLDGAVLALSAVVFGSLETLLYGMVAIFCSQQVMDGILYGRESGRMVVVVSGQAQSITQRILIELDRGVTLLEGRGGYSSHPKEVILCAVSSQQFPRLREIIHQEDPEAFVINADARQILGDGFLPIQREQG